MATNRDFAARVDVTESYASYLRSGDRLPSGKLLVRIILRYELDPIAAMDAYDKGAEPFGAYLRTEIFDREESKTDEPVPTS